MGAAGTDMSRKHNRYIRSGKGNSSTTAGAEEGFNQILYNFAAS